MPRKTLPEPPEPDFGTGYPLPPPPAMPEREFADDDEGSEPPAELVDLGNPPDDPLECQAYIYRAACVLIRDAMLDKSLSAAERRRECRILMGTCKALIPEASQWEIKKMILEDRAQLEERRRRPQLEPVTGEGQ